MECAGTLEIWKRSEELHYLRYVEVICDDDAKTIATLNDHKPYGDQVTITKDECLGHVQMRMGNRLGRLLEGQESGQDKVKVLKNQLRELKVVEKEKMKAQN